MNKTLEKIIIATSFVTLFSCETSSSGDYSSNACAGKENEQQTHCDKSENNCKTYSPSEECEKNGGTYNCSESTNEKGGNVSCSCYCSYPKDPYETKDKGW